MTNAYALLAKDLQKSVRAVMRRDDPASGDVLIEYIRDRQKHWAYGDWIAKLSEMEHSTQTVESFLEDHTP